MTIQNIIGTVLLMAGAALLYFGFQASQGIDEQMFEAFSGHFTDSTTWYLVGGVAASLSGLLLILDRPAHHARRNRNS